MDFTATYAHVHGACIAFSPGSTFLAYVAGKSRSTVHVRVSGTLDIVRSWELDDALDALEWSKDGLFLLVSAYSRNASDTDTGVSYVLPLDPDAAVTDGSDDGRGWVARIAAGVQGLRRAMWLPVWRLPSIIQFSQYDTSALVVSPADQSFTQVTGTLLPDVYGNSQWPDYFAVTQRERGRDYLALYAPRTPDAPTLDAPVVWDCMRSMPLATNEVAGVAWSPDGNYLAVWDTFLEYRVCLYTLGGTHVATLTLDDAGRPVVAAPLSSDECSRAIEPSRQPRRVLTHTQRSAPSWKRGAGTLLGVCHVTWHPSSEFLAVGGFDERVCVLTAEDWTVAYTLDYTTASLRRAAADVWQEPEGWFEATQGQGIVGMELVTEKIYMPAHSESDSSSMPRVGISWLEWNHDGTLLACRNAALPTLVFVHEFRGLLERRVDACLAPLAILVLSAPVLSVAWKPGNASTLAIATGHRAVYTWSQSNTGVQSADAIAVPNGAWFEA